MHGREIHSLAWVAQPTQDEPGLFVTVAEDTLMRLVRCGPLAESSGSVLRLDALPSFERHPGAMRAVATVQLASSMLVLAGGAKGILHAYAVDSGPQLRCVWSPGLPAHGCDR